MIKLCLDLKIQLSTKEISLIDIENKFISDQINGKQQNAWEWFKQFEKDSEILQIKVTKYKVKDCFLSITLNSGFNWRTHS